MAVFAALAQAVKGGIRAAQSAVASKVGAAISKARDVFGSAVGKVAGKQAERVARKQFTKLRRKAMSTIRRDIGITRGIEKAENLGEYVRRHLQQGEEMPVPVRGDITQNLLEKYYDLSRARWDSLPAPARKKAMEAFERFVDPGFEARRALKFRETVQNSWGLPADVSDLIESLSDAEWLYIVKFLPDYAMELKMFYKAKTDDVAAEDDFQSLRDTVENEVDFIRSPQGKRQVAKLAVRYAGLLKVK